MICYYIIIIRNRIIIAEPCNNTKNNVDLKEGSYVELDENCSTEIDKYYIKTNKLNKLQITN